MIPNTVPAIFASVALDIVTSAFTVIAFIAIACKLLLYISLKPD